MVFLKRATGRFSTNMLFPTVLLPRAIGEVPPQEISQKLFLGSAVTLLRDLCDNCLVLIDAHGHSLSGLKNAVAQWPPEYQKQGQMLIRRLETRNRLVRIGGGFALARQCREIPCQCCVGIAEALKPKALFAEGDCIACASSQIPNVQVIALRNYAVSPFFDERQIKSMTWVDGEWSQSDFESRVLRPLFAHARSLKIVDRHFGRSVRTRSSDNRAVLARAEIAERYRLSLEWIARVFAQAGGARGGHGLVIEIYTGKRTDQLGNQRQESSLVLDAVRRFSEALQRSLGFPVRVFLKSETRAREMQHDRFLITDQAGLLVGRGLDILLDNASMRRINASFDPVTSNRLVHGTTISMVDENECSKIEAATRTLPDLM